MKLHIVIHIIYLCEKPDSEKENQRKTSKFFGINTDFKSQISAYFRSFFVLQAQIVFSAIEARFCRIFMANFAKFFNFFQTIQGQCSEISDFQAGESLLRFKKK